MLYEFAAVVDPIFAHVLHLLSRIATSQGDQNIDRERDAIRLNFDVAEKTMLAIPNHRKQWELARYALVAWIDEVLIEAPWSGRQKWQDNLLEFAFYQSRDRAEGFFHKATQAKEAGFLDALEVFYLAVMLGFQGLYGVDDRIERAHKLKIPTSLKVWADDTGLLVKPKSTARFDTQHRELGSCSPLVSVRHVIAGLLLVVTLLATSAVVYHYASRPSSQGLLP
jgi:type VI secretion system protein ImpK